MFWIVFQLGSLIGFIFLGIAAFKLTPDQMNAEAGKYQVNSTPLNLTLPMFVCHSCILFSALSTNIAYIPLCFVCYPRFVVGCRLAFTLVFLLLFVDRYRVVTQCHKLLLSSHHTFSALTRL